MPVQARIVLLTGEQMGRVYPITDSTVLGRGVGVGIQLCVSDISRLHARIQRNELGQWTLEDMRSSNGTWLDGLPVTDTVPLRFGSRIQLGADTLMVFTHHDTLEEKIFQAQKLESLGRLAGEVAHDLRNLLTVYRCNIDFINECHEKGMLFLTGGLDDAEFKEVLKQLTDATDRSAELTGRLLGFARQGPVEHSPVEITRLLTDVLALARDSFPDEIWVEHAPCQEVLTVTASAGRLHQAFMNLFINARDAMADGGVLRVKEERFRLKHAGELNLPLPAPAEYARIIVEDTGCGMPPEVMEQIFEPFFTTKAKGKGTGLGLATVYSVVKEHGGHITVESTQGKGTAFHVLLPLPTETFKSQGTVKLNALVHTSPGVPSSVLLFHPGGEGRDAIGLCLHSMGLAMIWSRSGGDCIRLLERHAGQVTLVLLDTTVEDMDIQLMARLIKRRVPGIPVIVLVKPEEDGSLPAICSSWSLVDEVHPYPIDGKKLRKALEEFLSHHQESTPSA